MIKFAIWGIGIRGKTLLRMLKDKVACIIEQDRKFHHTYYENIPIVSLEEYIALRYEYPIIITPKNYEKEIKDKLNANGIYEAFYYSKSIILIEAFFSKTPIKNSLKKYDKSKEIIVYGGSLLGYLLYDYLTDNKYICRLALQYGYSGQVRLTDGVVEWKKELIKSDQIILCIPMVHGDEREIEGLEKKFEKYYETIKFRDLYYNPSLENFKDIHHGKRCFIVATGPSLKMEDLEKLYQNGEYCLSVNGIFSAFQMTKWRPDYYLASDPDAVSRWKDSILSEKISEKFIASRAWIFDGESTEENMHKWYVFRNLNEGELPEFSDDFARGTYSGMTVVYDGALQLAVYMGFSEIYLLGVDCNYKKGSKENYFFKEEEEDSADHHESEMILAYRAADQYARKRGIKIYNATRGGMLEEFERVDFDSLFN